MSKTIAQIQSGALTDFLTGESQLIAGTYEQNINGDGKLSLTWKSTQGGGLKAGEEVTVAGLTYYLKEAYAPTANSDGTYTWSPTFVSTDEKLKGLPVYKTVKLIYIDNQQKNVKIYTYPYTGQAGTLVTDLNRLYPGRITLAERYDDVLISVSFDQDNLVSAAQKIASALDTTSTIENGVVCIGTHNALAVKDHYDRFVILGGTRNMGKAVLDGDDAYAAVTLRLMLPDEYPDSVIPKNAPEEGHMTKFLIFDDIYPKMELTIGSVRRRVCYLYDEEGKHIMVSNDGVLVEKTYTKFYITLNLGSSAYNFNVQSVIEGRTLGLVFQSGLLTGREFDLAYYDDYVNEYDSEEDVSEADAHGLAGEYRICLVADGDTLLPNDTLAPREGDKVTLTGVKLDGAYEADARQRLLDAALAYTGMYLDGQTRPTEIHFEAETQITDFLTGESTSPTAGSSYAGQAAAEELEASGQSSLGDERDNYIVTSVTTDIITGAQSVHFGTFEPQGKMASMANQLEQVSLSGGGALVGTNEEDYIRHTAAMSLDQFKTLYDIYGHLGMKTVNKRIDQTNGSLEALSTMFQDVKNQSDRQFLIWFGNYMPSPLASDPSATANFPASDWTTDDEKEVHLQDVFYNTLRPAGSIGGRMWRWVRESDELDNLETGETLVIYTYYWEEITDADTLAALEKIADVVNDSVITGGAEKSRVKMQWLQAVEEYARYTEQAEDYFGEEVDSEDSAESEIVIESDEYDIYDLAYKALAKMLNNGTDATSSILNGRTMPSWLSNLSTDTRLTGTNAADNYRNTWNAYHAALTNLDAAIKDKAKELAAAAQTAAAAAMEKYTAMADDSILDATEKLTIKRDFISFWHEMMDQGGILDRASVITGTSPNRSVGFVVDSEIVEDYIEAYAAVGTFLNGLDDGEPDEWTVPVRSDIVDVWSGYSDASGTSGTIENNLPLWLDDDISESNDIDGDDWIEVWSGFFAKRGELLTALTEAGQIAKTKIDDFASDGVLTTMEKQLLIKEWESIKAEYPLLLQQAGGTVVSTASYMAAYDALYNYLCGTSDTSDVGTVSGVIVALLSATEDEELEDAYTTLVGLSISDTNMQDACNALYAYLNPTGTNDPTMAETIATAVLALRDWLYGENEDPAMLYDLQHDTTIVAATYKAVWSNYYKERTSLLADLGRKALIELQMMGSDNVLTAEEKKTVIREWEKVVAQNAGFVAQLSLSHIDETSGNYDATLQAYDSAYCALYTYLDTLSHTPDQNFNYKSTISSGHPAMLRNGETTEGSATAVSGTFNGAYFTSMWNNYYSAAEALQTALSTTNIQTFVSATLPQPPYKVGDLWVCIPANNASGVYKVYICIVAKAKGATAAQSDWKEYEIPQDPSDPTGLLASIVEKLYTDYKDTDAKWPFTVTLNVTNGNKVTAANAPSTAISGFDATLNLLLAFLGNKVFHVYRSKDISSQQLVEYDLKATPVVFTVPGTQETLEGGIEISMYDGTGWTYLQESTSGLIENLGNMILATVFGINQGTIEASGLSLGQRFAYLFSQATVWDATANNGQGGYVTLTQALFGLSIQQDANGHYYSSAQLRGDKIDFRGKDIILGASDKLNFKGGEINFTAGSDNGESDGNGGTIDNGGIINFSGAKQINLNANEVNLNAEKLTWNGTAQNPRVIIDDGNGNSKFSVDENGNVTMNNFTAMNGNIVGRVKTSDGSCIVESLTPYNNTNYNWKGLAIIRDADAVVDDSTYITTTTQDVATFGVRKYNSSQTMSYIGHANADVSGFEEARVFLLGRDANGNPVGKIEMSGLQPAIAIGSPTNNTIILRGNTGEVACTDLNASGNVEAADIIGSGIIINGSTVTLPSDAKTGTIRIVKATTVNAGLAGSIIMPNSTTAVSSLTLNSKTALFVYDGTYWQVIITDTI